jgi:hypothetical protein
VHERAVIVRSGRRWVTTDSSRLVALLAAFLLTVDVDFHDSTPRIALAATAGLVAAYSFDEGSGTVVQDLSGNANHGTVSGATWTTQGRYGGALQFDGINDIVNIPDGASLDLTSGMTLMAWVRPTANGGWRTVVLKETSNELVYGLYANDSSTRPSAWIRSGNAAYSTAGTAAVPLNTWTNLAATYGGGTLRLYVNGTLATSRALTVPINISASPLRIGGNRIWSEWFAGLIDEVRVYNRALSQAEIQSDMATPLGGVPPPPPDTTPPAASMVSPADGALVAGVVSVSGSANDDTAVAGVQFLLDGVALGGRTRPPHIRSRGTRRPLATGHTRSRRAREMPPGTPVRPWP